MNRVSDLVKLVDSKDIAELQLKQLDIEILIRKKEALPQSSSPDPVYLIPPPTYQSALPPSTPAPESVSSRPSSPTSAPAPTKPTSSHPPLKCPMAGNFYRSPAPGEPPFVKVGDKVQKGQVICIIEAMKLMNDIEADHSGTVVEILVDDGKPVSLDMMAMVWKENSAVEEEIKMSSGWHFDPSGEELIESNLLKKVGLESLPSKVMRESSVMEEEIRPPAGWRFDPTDEELIELYMSKKVGSESLLDKVMKEIDAHQSPLLPSPS
ncbi:hypothetical protein SASPL_152419 [Salvia splendens]|uniref:Biotin carboxyl carrier protein of acetyl-CoA carboxylase n=1 Tax=Salvia splendens TaxID=180675 RepID=A0A8X8W309_SALSN|nr:hypothetical protein SASPL_152419 [Salvia splendens]